MSERGDTGLTLMRWRQSIETLHDARVLLAQGCSGRSVVNRAYYAAFYAVMALIESDGKSSGKHSGVISIFDVVYVKSGRIERPVSQKLHALFLRRMQDDYEEVDYVSGDDARDAVMEATIVMRAIRTVLAQDLQGVGNLPAIPE